MSLLVYITGCCVPRKESLKVEFMETTDSMKAIVARTCSNEILFPQGVFRRNDEEAAQKFTLAMNTVIDLKGSLLFNTV